MPTLTRDDLDSNYYRATCRHCEWMVAGLDPLPSARAHADITGHAVLVTADVEVETVRPNIESALSELRLCRNEEEKEEVVRRFVEDANVSLDELRQRKNGGGDQFRDTVHRFLRRQNGEVRR